MFSKVDKMSIKSLLENDKTVDQEKLTNSWKNDVKELGNNEAKIDNFWFKKLIKSW